MLARELKFSKMLVWSFVIHIVVLILLGISYQFSSKTPVLANTGKSNDIINAVVVADVAVKPMLAPVMTTKPIVKERYPEPPPIQPKVVSESTPPKQVVIIPTKKIKKMSPDKVAQQLLADLKKQTQIKKQQKQKSVDNMLKQMKKLTEKSLQQQMLQEQQRINSIRQQQMQGEVNKYKALILQVISQHWLIPGTQDKKVFAELLIRLAPGGVVLDVQVLKSSGNEALDRSALAAVFKSSPLPVPGETDAFEAFRQFVLRLRPENVST